MIKKFIKEAFGGFNGGEDVYTDFENGHIDKVSDLLYLVRDIHDIERNEPIYVIFHEVEFVEGGWLSNDKEYHFSCCITEWGISFAGIETNIDEEVCYRISWDDIDKVIVGRYKKQEESELYDFAYNALYEIKKVIKIYDENGDYVSIPMCYISNYNGFDDAVNDFLELRDKYDEDQHKEEVDISLEIQKLFEQNNYEEILRIMEENNLWDSSNYYYQYIGIISLLELNRKLEADRRFLAFEKSFLSIDEEEYRKYNDNYDYLKNYYLVTKGLMEVYEQKWYDASVTLSLARELGLSSDEVGAKKV